MENDVVLFTGWSKIECTLYPDADMLVTAPSATKANNFFNTLNKIKTALPVPYDIKLKVYIKVVIVLGQLFFIFYLKL